MKIKIATEGEVGNYSPLINEMLKEIVS